MRGAQFQVARRVHEALVAKSTFSALCRSIAEAKAPGMKPGYCISSVLCHYLYGVRLTVDHTKNTGKLCIDAQGLGINATFKKHVWAIGLDSSRSRMLIWEAFLSVSIFCALNSLCASVGLSWSRSLLNTGQ